MKENLRSGLGIKALLTRGWRYLTPPDPRRIFWVNFAVTYRCNSRCRHCRIWEIYLKSPGLVSKELELEDIARTFSESSWLKNLEGVGLTGGEPFLREDFAELAGIFIRRYPEAFLSVATNGLAGEVIVARTEQILRKYHPKFFGISISLDGIGNTHDRMRGVEGAYLKALGTIEGLRRETPVQLGVSFTITPENYRDILEVYKLSRRIGLKFITCFAHNSAVYYRNEETSFAWEPDAMQEVAALIKKLTRNKIQNEGFIMKLVDPYACFMADSIKELGSNRRLFNCHSGSHSFFLDPYGYVFPCLFRKEGMGNIREMDFDTLWLAPEAARLRKEIREGGCHCWVACETVPSLLCSLQVVKWNFENKFWRRDW